jgi:hypothetical protein
MKKRGKEIEAYLWYSRDEIQTLELFQGQDSLVE